MKKTLLIKLQVRRFALKAGGELSAGTALNTQQSEAQLWKKICYFSGVGGGQLWQVHKSRDFGWRPLYMMI